MKNNVPQLTEEEKAAGVTLTAIPLDELASEDISDRNVERMARGFIMGTTAIGRRREVREILEDRVTKKIGRKGKYLVDKLFELIDGVTVVEKASDGKNGTAVHYYKTPPNLNAIIYALDRVLGKPKQFTEHSEEKRGVILVEHVIRNLASNPYKKTNYGNGAGKNLIGGGERGAGEADGAGIGIVKERVAEGAGASAL